MARRSQEEIEAEHGNLCDKGDGGELDTWGEAALATLDWVLGNIDSRPSEED